MGVVYFTQPNPVRVELGDVNKMLAQWLLPVGGYVIIAKFAALSDAVGGGESNPQFTLHFAGAQDSMFCKLGSHDSRTIVLTVAQTFEGPVVFQGHTVNTSPVRLVCKSTAIPFEVTSLTLTAIEVDSVHIG
jgi:hypothetical protein